MIKIIEGKPDGKGKKIAIVVSKFNDFITKRLLEGCLKELKACGTPESSIQVAWVPGSLEIPVIALKMARKKDIQAVICLGSVIRGETIHFDLVARGVADGVAKAALQTAKPVIFGVLTTETVEQAYKRTQAKGDHKGRDAAIAALEMIDVLRKIKHA